MKDVRISDFQSFGKTQTTRNDYEYFTTLPQFRGKNLISAQVHGTVVTLFLNNDRWLADGAGKMNQTSVLELYSIRMNPTTFEDTRSEVILNEVVSADL